MDFSLPVSHSTSAPSLGVCGALISERPRHGAGARGMAVPSDRPQREQGQGMQLRFVAALRPALDSVYKGKVRSFTGLQLSL